MRILFITDTLPYPPVSGNRLRIYHLCRQLATKHEVWLVAPGNGSENSQDIDHMRTFCHEVIVIPRGRSSRWQHVAGIVRYALAGQPLELSFEYCEALAQKVTKIVSEVDFDIVHFEPSYIALYREAIPANAKCKTILGYHNIDFSLYNLIAQVERRLTKKARAYFHSWQMRGWEPHYAARFDRCVTVSEVDRQLLQGANRRLNVEVCPNGVDTQELHPLSEPTSHPNLLFVGSMSYPACADASIFFCDNVLPHIQREVPNVEMWLVGRNPPPEVMRLANDMVHVTGWVEDVIPYYQDSLVCVVPLRAGGGTRLKILEAMALGRPVVSTAKGCEGLDVVDGEHIFIADNPEEFARKTVKLLTDVQLRQLMIKKARGLVVNHYDWRALAERLINIYLGAIHDRSGSPNLTIAYPDKAEA